MRPNRAGPPGPIFVLVVALTLVGCATATLTPSPAATAPTSSTIAQPAPTSSSIDALPALVDVPFYRDDVLGRLVEPGPGPSQKPAVAWQAEIGPTHWAPILANGMIVVGTTAGEVIALDGLTGTKRWTFHAAQGLPTDSFNGSAAAADGLIFVNDRSTVYALDAATGAQRWSAPAPTKGSRPLVVDGVLYLGTIGGALGLDDRSGKVLWSWTGPQGIGTTIGPVADAVAYLSSRGDGRLYAIDTHDGSEHWHVQTVGSAVGSSEVVGDTIFVGTNQAGAAGQVGQVYAVDRASGRVRWQFGGPKGGQIVPGPARDSVLYLSSETDGIYAVKDSGTQATPVWHEDAPPSVVPLSMVGDTLYEQRTDGSIGAYAASDGTLRWETPSTGDYGGGPPLVSGGMIFSVGDAQGVKAYADPGLIAMLPSASVAPSPSAAPSVARVPDPFTVVKSISWDSTKLAIPLGMDAGPDGLLYILDTKPSVTVIDPNDGHIVRTWGRQGTGPGEFDLTRADDNPGTGDVGVAPDGKVYVADGSNHRVQVFRSDGTFVSQFGSFGTGDGQFGSIDEIAIGRDGSVYLRDLVANRINKFTADGKFLWRSPARSSDPDLASNMQGIAVRPDGSVLVSCETCDHLQIFDAISGRLVGKVPMPEIDGDAGSIALDQTGNIDVSTYFSESTLVFDPKGTLIAARYLTGSMQRMDIGKQATWGDVFWPSPVYLPNGRAFTFWKNGLAELKVTLPQR